jgi:MFS family permease
LDNAKPDNGARRHDPLTAGRTSVRPGRQAVASGRADREPGFFQLFQGVGAAMLIANSAAIVTDAFPQNQRGMALGVNQAAAISGTFLGLVLGGLLATIDWHLIFLISVPIGVLGTVWGYRTLRELGQTRHAHIDWIGNITFALGLLAIMIGVTYGIQPYGHDNTGWSSPLVKIALISGVVILGFFCWIETKVKEPLFRLPLLRIRAFSAGLAASFLAALARGGLMLMLVIWLQGICQSLKALSKVFSEYSQ